MKRLIISAFAAIGLAGAAYAVPAMPGLLPFTQPDGTTVNVRLVGDERGHYYLSEDNYPLLTDANGRLCYAKYGADGSVVASEVQARNVVRRVAADNGVMAENNAEEIAESLRRQVVARAEANIPQKGMGLSATRFPGKGEIRSLVILVNYKDVKFKTENPNEYFTALLNAEGFSQNGGTGSARDFYIEGSNGNFIPTFDVVGPVDLPENRRYYGANQWGSDIRAQEMVIDACKLLDDEVDFSKYDYSGDGFIDNVFVFYAGEGEATSRIEEAVWPHSYNVFSAGAGTYRFDRKILNHYACTNEWETAYNRPAGIGTFCHEFGHVLGLPDLYATDYNHDEAPKSWAVMASGAYNNNGRTPPTFSAYERNALGWVDLEVLNKPTTAVLDHIQDSNFAYLIQTENEKEFFLLENRQLKGWDAYLPNSGMLVWHIDFNEELFNVNTPNNNKLHQCVDIVEASNSTYNPANMCYPGGMNITQLTSLTRPGLVSWSGNPIDVPLTNIREVKGQILFDVKGGVSSVGNPASITADMSKATPYSLVLNWPEAENASQYILSIWTGDKQYLPGYEERFVRGTTHTVTGLTAETTYNFSLRAKAGDLISTGIAEGSAKTPKITFGYSKVEVLPATNVSSKGFTANWKTVEGAEDYLLSINVMALSGANETKADMGSTGVATLPEGWDTNSTKTSTSVNYAGVRPPALYLNGDKEYMTTQVFSDEISSVKFWYRGATSADSNSAEVQFRGSESADWKTAMAITPIVNTLGGTTVTVDAPAGSHQVRIIFNQVGSGTIVLDDIVVTTNVISKIPIDGFSELNVGNATSYDFERTDDMPSGDEFFYTVKAVDEYDRRTLDSEEVRVSLSNGSAVGNIAVEEVNITVNGLEISYAGQADQVMNVYDTTGMLVATAKADGNGYAAVQVPARGLYIVTANGKSVKALCR